MSDVGKYILVREGWQCNLCGKMFWIDKKRKPHCGSAPYVLSHQVICNVSRKHVGKLKREARKIK